MRIAILTTQIPFVVGGAELLAQGLEQALCEAGHEAEIVSIPFKWYPSLTVLDHMLAARALDLSEFNAVKIDLAIGLKFPAYLIGHPNKTFWVLHQHRQAYDLWDVGESNLLEDEDGQVVREAIRAADNAVLSSPGRVFTISANVAKRLLRYNNVEATPLYHPPPLAGRLAESDIGDYFFYPSRINRVKRQEFVLRSLSLADRSIQVVFAGAPDTPDYGRSLRDLAVELGVSDRVSWRGRVSDSEMIDLYAEARAVVFTPLDEDLGYITLEAMLAGKPLLTVSDAGEPASLIRHGVEGLVTNPEPRAFAEAMDRLASSKDLARDLGRAALQSYRAMDVSWPRVVSALTTAEATANAPAPKISAGRRTRTRAAFEGLREDEDQASVVDWLADRPTDDAPSLQLLAERYAFDDHLARHRDYYETHWPRYRATLDAVRRSGVGARRILELGSSAPYVSTAFLKEALPEAEFTVAQQTPPGAHWRHRIGGKGWGGFEIDAVGLNVETTPWPFEDGAFDLVVAMEILEHLAIDPGFFFREARRVLRQGGAFLVTTPNLVSAGAVTRALEGKSPYSFGVFVPWNGAYGRHNREYTPAEVESLGRYAGLELGLLETADVYPNHDNERPALRYMAERRHPLDLRGQNIFYVGRKTAEAAAGPLPRDLFLVDPAIFSGRLELQRPGEVPDGLCVRVVNTSPLTWPATGPERVRLTVDRVDQNGLVEVDILSIDLPADLEPGGALEIPVSVLASPQGLGCWHEIGLYLEGAGPFRGAGRLKPACVFADRLEAAPARPPGPDAA